MASRLINKFGTGAVDALGATLFTMGIVAWLCLVDSEPRYLAEFLPGQILTGSGVGLVIPSMTGVTVKALPSHQWGSVPALSNTARQLGMVISTAILTLVHQPDINLTAVRQAWELMSAFAAAAALITLALALGWKPSEVRG